MYSKSFRKDSSVVVCDSSVVACDSSVVVCDPSVVLVLIPKTELGTNFLSRTTYDVGKNKPSLYP